LIVIVSFLLLAVNIATSFSKLAKSALENSGVLRQIIDKDTFSSIFLFFACTSTRITLGKVDFLSSSRFLTEESVKGSFAGGGDRFEAG